MKISCFILFTLLILALSLTEIQAAEWILKQCPIDFDQLKTLIDSMSSENWIPSGIEVFEQGQNKGVWILFTKNDHFKYKNWAITWHENPFQSIEQWQKTLTEYMQRGFMPIDIAWTESRIYVLYLHNDAQAREWLIDWSIKTTGTYVNYKKIKELTRKYISMGYTPVGLSISPEENTVFLLFIKMSHSFTEYFMIDFSMKEYADANQNFIEKGYSLISFAYAFDKFYALFLAY